MVFMATGITEPSASVSSPLCTIPNAPKVATTKKWLVLHTMILMY